MELATFSFCSQPLTYRLPGKSHLSFILYQSVWLYDYSLCDSNWLQKHQSSSWYDTLFTVGRNCNTFTTIYSCNTTCNIFVSHTVTMIVLLSYLKIHCSVFYGKFYSGFFVLVLSWRVLDVFREVLVVSREEWELTTVAETVSVSRHQPTANNGLFFWISPDVFWNQLCIEKYGRYCWLPRNDEEWSSSVNSSSWFVNQRIFDKNKKAKPKTQSMKIRSIV